VRLVVVEQPEPRVQADGETGDPRLTFQDRVQVVQQRIARRARAARP
jgi:hypothetical protein